MNGRVVMIVAVAVTVGFTSVAAAGPVSTKQRVAITVKFHEKTFVLSPFRKGPLVRDSGTFTDDAPNAPCRDVIRDGQKAAVCEGGRWTLTGKRGTIAIRTTAEWVDPGSGGCGVAFGTWKVVRGTGEYTHLTGSGRSAYDAHCSKWYARHEGFLTLP